MAWPKGKKLECRTEPTEKEIEFCDQLRKLLKRMPKTMKLFADGNLRAVSSGCDSETTGFQPLAISVLCDCDGGDPWQ